MCACEPGFTCPSCRGVTQRDDNTEHDPEPNDPLAEAERLDRIHETEWKKP